MNLEDKHSGSDEAEVATGELARRCALCHVPIAAQFFTMRCLIVCPDCASKVVKRQEAPGRRRRAAILGLATAAVFALLWFLATRSTGRPLSPLALAAGLAIGLAVHQGSGGRGGRRYQLIAVLLVYTAFIGRYVPPVFGGIADAIKEQHSKKWMGENNRDTPVTTTPEPARPLAHSGKAIEKHISKLTSMSEQNSVSATIKAYFLFTLVAWGLVLAAPFMLGTSGFLGTLCLAAGLALACPYKPSGFIVPS